MPEHENKTLHPAAHAPTMRGVPRVVAITTSYRRPAQLAQLFDSLATEAPSLAGALVVDNANDPAVEAVAGRATVPVRVLAPGRNLGCGGGVAFGLRDALRDPAVTHAWIFDDDAAATPGALAALLAALDLAQADAAMPLVTNATGHIGWYPGPLAQPAWSIVRQAGVKFEPWCDAREQPPHGFERRERRAAGGAPRDRHRFVQAADRAGFQDRPGQLVQPMQPLLPPPRRGGGRHRLRRPTARGARDGGGGSELEKIATCSQSRRQITRRSGPALEPRAQGD